MMTSRKSRSQVLTLSLAAVLLLAVSAAGCAKPQVPASPPATSATKGASQPATLLGSREASHSVTQTPSPAAYGTSDEWSYLKDQRGGEGSGLTTIPSRVSATEAAKRIALLLHMTPRSTSSTSASLMQGAGGGRRLANPELLRPSARTQFASRRFAP